jgi:hypothetical protein
MSKAAAQSASSSGNPPKERLEIARLRAVLARERRLEVARRLRGDGGAHAALVAVLETLRAPEDRYEGMTRSR